MVAAMMDAVPYGVDYYIRLGGSVMNGHELVRACGVVLSVRCLRCSGI